MMKNQLMTFSSEELNFSMSGVLYEGKPAFDAVELAKSLGYADPHDALKKHCKSLIKLNSGETQELGFGFRPKGIALAGQADMFRLILRSQLPSAEKVQNWVCEDVLPSIMETGSYSMSGQQQNLAINPDFVALARAVTESTASAMMKTILETTGIQAVVHINATVSAAPVSPLPAATTAATQTKISTGSEMPNTDSEYVPVHKVSWETGLSDPSCRRLVRFANLPARQLPGVRGLCVQREAFIHAFQVLLEESTPPGGKRKRWQHPEFGGFILRKETTRGE